MSLGTGKEKKQQLRIVTSNLDKRLVYWIILPITIRRQIQ